MQLFMGMVNAQGCSLVVILFLSTRSISNRPSRIRAMGVMVLWGSPSVSANTKAASSVYPRHAFRILSARSTIRPLSVPFKRITDIGHLTMPASTSSKPLNSSSFSTGALAMANS